MPIADHTAVLHRFGAAALERISERGDWYEALLTVALDLTHDPDEALRMADEAWEAQSEEPADDDSDPAGEKLITGGSKGWITLEPSGTHVYIEGDGKITGGPSALEGRNVSHLPSQKVGAEHGERHPKTGQSGPKADKPSESTKAKSGGQPRQFSDVKEAHQWGSEQYAAWADSLSKDEYKAVGRYMNDTYRPINNALRESAGKDAGEYNGAVKLIDGALARATVPEDLIAYRGVGSGVVSKLKVGETFTDHGYGSTTLATEAADNYGADAIFEIKVPKGAHAAYATAIMKKPDAPGREQEFLLPRNSQYKITSIEKGDDGRTRIKAELASPSADKPSESTEKQPQAAAKPDSQAAKVDSFGPKTPAEKKAKEERTSTPEFKQWFGGSKVTNQEDQPQETGGTAKKVFHGRSVRFEEFDKAKAGSTSGAGEAGNGFYFAEDRRIADSYAKSGGESGHVLESYLSIENPLDFDAEIGHQDLSKWEQVGKEIFGSAFDGAKFRRAATAKRATGYHVWSMMALHSKAGRERANEVIQKLGYDGIVHHAQDREGSIREPGSSDAVPNYGRCWIAFEPNQIKATDNKGTWSKESGNMYKSFEEPSE